VPLHQLLGERLGTLQVGAGRLGAENGYPVSRKHVCHADDQRRFRSHDDEVDGVALHPLGNECRVFVVDRDVGGQRGGAAVTRRAEDLGSVTRAGERCDDRMLATSAAEYKDTHGCYPPSDQVGMVNLIVAEEGAGGPTLRP